MENGTSTLIIYLKKHGVNVMRKLVFLFDRRSLERIYILFIRPLLEYADVVWDNWITAIEKVQLEATRIVTGTTKLVSLDELYKKICWESLETRCAKHKLSSFHEMNNNISPEYLSTFVPQPVESATRYNLRDATNIRQPLTRTQLYYNSFRPSSTRLWNELPVETRAAIKLTSFKYQINKNIKKPPKYYTVGDRFGVSKIVKKFRILF